MLESTVATSSAVATVEATASALDLFNQNEPSPPTKSFLVPPQPLTNSDGQPVFSKLDKIIKSLGGQDGCTLSMREAFHMERSTVVCDLTGTSTNESVTSAPHVYNTAAMTTTALDLSKNSSPLNDNGRHKPWNMSGENFGAVVNWNQSKCLICRKIFVLRKSLIYHARVYHKDLLSSSSSNGTVASFDRPVRSPVKQHIDSTYPYVCEICNSKFMVRNSLRRHKKERHPELYDPPTDETNSLTDNTLQDGQVDGSGNSEVTIYPCDVCGAQFTIRASMTAHRSRKHGPALATAMAQQTGTTLSSFPCRHCGKFFPQESSLRSHVGKKHPGESTLPGYACPECDEVFSMKLSMRNHCAKMHGRKLATATQENGSDSLNDNHYNVNGVQGDRFQMYKKKKRTDLAKYEPYCDFQRILCLVCGNAYDKRNKLLIHVFRQHLPKESPDSMMLPKLDDNDEDLSGFTVEEPGSVGGVASVSQDSGVDMTSSAVSEDFTTTCDFNTLSCKVCRRTCDSRETLKKHAAWRHRDLVVTSSSEESCIKPGNSSETSSIENRSSTPIEAMESLYSDDDENDLEISEDGQGLDEENGDLESSLGRHSGTSFRIGEKRNYYSMLNDGHKSPASPKKHFISDYMHVINFGSKTCLLCTRAFANTNCLRRHMVNIHGDPKTLTVPNSVTVKLEQL